MIFNQKLNVWQIKKSQVYYYLLLELLSLLQLTQSSVSTSIEGTRTLEHKSIVAYEKHIRGLSYICSLIGDYDSMLILLDKSPLPFCPAMDSKIIADFINYKRNKKGIFLKYLSN